MKTVLMRWAAVLLAVLAAHDARAQSSTSSYIRSRVRVGQIVGGYGDYLREGRDQIYRNISPIASIAPFLLPKTVGLTAVLRW